MTIHLHEESPDQPEPMRCTAHPDVETRLTCGRCDTPICPRCMVFTPVGARCRNCARLRRLPTFEVSAAQYVLAAAIAMGVALALGALWGLLPLRGYGVFLGAAAAGYVAGEVVSRGLGRKRSRGLKAIAGLAVVAAYLVSRLTPLVAQLGPAALPAVLPALVVATLTSPVTLLALALGVYLAVTRIDA